jgi:hypothetical protein
MFDKEHLESAPGFDKDNWPDVYFFYGKNDLPLKRVTLRSRVMSHFSNDHASFGDAHCSGGRAGGMDGNSRGAGGASPGIKIDQGTPAHTQQAAATLRRSASLITMAYFKFSF